MASEKEEEEVRIFKEEFQKDKQKILNSLDNLTEEEVIQEILDLFYAPLDLDKDRFYLHRYQKLTKEAERIGIVTPSEAREVLDKLMVTYRIITENEKGEPIIGNEFLDFLDTMGKEIDTTTDKHKQKQMSGMEFVEYVLIPRYLAAVKVCKEKHLSLSGYIHSIDSSKILSQEISKEAKKILDSYSSSSDKKRWSELRNISIMTHGVLMTNLSQNYMLSLPDAVIKQLMRKK